jgi:phage terminase large subunit-like protein
MSHGHRTKKEIAERTIRLQAKLAKLQGKPQPGPDIVPPPHTASPSPTLQGFLAAVRYERETFDARMQAGQTVCLDTGSKLYEFPEGDAAQIARQYALDITSGQIPACELIRYAAKRFLDDLEKGSGRKIFFDPVAARNICTFARDFCYLELLNWEVWALANMFAWKKPTGFRRFEECHLSVARKNGKTTFAAIVALFLLIADQEELAEVYSAATAKNTAVKVWTDVERIVKANPELSAAIKRYKVGDLEFDTEATRDCHFKPLASEERSFLGERASGIVADELGSWTDRNSWDYLVQSTATRKQPMTLAISTAPESRQCFCWEKYMWVEKILRGTVEADHVWAAIYTIDADDDPKNIKALKKSHPSLGSSFLSEEFLEKEIKELEEVPSKLPNFLQFRANVTPERSLSQQVSITSEQWDRCAHLELLPQAKGPSDAAATFGALNKDKFCWIGLDAGATDDMFAIGYVWREGYLEPHTRDKKGNIVWAVEHKKRFVAVDYYMPEDRLIEKERKWKVPLSTWVNQEFIKLLPGDMVDDREVKKYLVETVFPFLTVYDVGYDKWQLQSMAAELNERSSTKFVEVPQTPSTLTNPIREFLADIRRGEIVHWNNPVLRWNIENVYFGDQDDTSHGGLKPCKAGNNGILKIDGVQALITAYARMLAAPLPISGRIFSI